jgi:hypothetical protein
MDMSDLPIPPSSTPNATPPAKRDVVPTVLTKVDRPNPGSSTGAAPPETPMGLPSLYCDPVKVATKLLDLAVSGRLRGEVVIMSPSAKVG